MRGSASSSIPGEGCGRLDVDVHLLADVERDRGLLRERVEDLKHPGVDALGVRAGEALLGDDIGLDVEKRERETDLGTPLQGGDRLGPRDEVRQVLLIDVDPHVQLVDIAQDDHRLVPDQAGVLAEPDVHLKDLAVDQGTDDQPFEVDLDALDLALRLLDGRAVDHLSFSQVSLSRLRSASIRASVALLAR